jgi:hypothetical protein
LVLYSSTLRSHRKAASAMISVQPRIQGMRYEIEHHGDSLLIITNKDGAKNQKLMQVSLAGLNKSATAAAGQAGQVGQSSGISADQWKDVKPYNPAVQIDSVLPFKDHFAIFGRENGLEVVWLVEAKKGNSGNKRSSTNLESLASPSKSSAAGGDSAVAAAALTSSPQEAGSSGTAATATGAASVNSSPSKSAEPTPAATSTPSADDGVSGYITNFISNIPGMLFGTSGELVLSDWHKIEFEEAVHSVWAGDNCVFDSHVLRLGYSSLVTPK